MSKEAAPSERSTLERPRIETVAIEVAPLRLEVIAGADIGKALDVDPEASQGRVFVGKSSACDLALSDALASRRHCAFALEGSSVRVTDLDSTNGTFVNGVRIVEALLVGGEMVRVGDTTIAVRVGASRTRRLPGATRFGRLLGASPAMQRLHPLCERLARADIPVVLEGETGTGKELLAEAMHEASSRANGPFVVFDCTTSPAGLLEARLFGHERGAFTGAVTARPGVFEEASGGTLLIDEIGDLDVTLQAKLLRAVQSGQVQRLGGTAWIRTNVRVLAATRRDLEREIQAGRFRDDLYYRLAVARIELPPLRSREGDVRLLAEHFWSIAMPGPRGAAPGSGAPGLGEGLPISEELLARFESYNWPGNVRELYNAVLHHAALGDLATELPVVVPSAPRSASPSQPPPTLQSRDSGLDASSSSSSSLASRGTSESGDVVDAVIARNLSFPQAKQKVVENFEERYVDAMLARHDNSISKAAAAAGIARRYFYTIRTRRGR